MPIEDNFMICIHCPGAYLCIIPLITNDKTNNTASTQNSQAQNIINATKDEMPTTKKLYLTILPWAILLAAIPMRRI